MALFDIEHPETGEIITVESDVSPTQEQALATISSLPVTPERRFAAQYRKEQQASPSSKLAALAEREISGEGVLGGLANIIGRGAVGFGKIAASGLQPQPDEGIAQKIREAVVRTVGGPVMGVPGLAEIIARASPNLAQTEYEAASRMAYDLGQQIPTTPSELGKAALMGTPGGAQMLALQSLLPKTPTPEETQAAFLAQEEAKQVQAARGAPIAPEVFGEANIPAAELGPLLPTVPGVAGALGKVASVVTKPISKMISRGFKTPTIEKATGLLDITPSEGLVETLDRAVPRIIEASGKKGLPTKGVDAIKAAEKAANISFNEAIDNLKNAEKVGLSMQGDTMIQVGQDAILGTFESYRNKPELVNQIISKFDYLKGEIKPTQGQKLLKELNTEYERFVDKKSPEALAYKAVRNELASQLDEIVKVSSEKDISPYSDWGKILDVKSGIQGRIKRYERSAGEAAVPISEESGIGRATTVKGQLVGAALRRGSRMTRVLTKQGIEYIDEATESIFKDSPRRVSREALTEAEVINLRNKYLKPPVIGSIPSAPVVSNIAKQLPLPYGITESQLENTIKTIPQSLRGDPAMERKIALSILKSK